MALGEIAKQLAGQAIGNPAKDMIEALQEPSRAPKPAAETVCQTMVGQLQAMQKALKDDQELVVTCQAGDETVRVLECFMPTSQVLVLSGLDREKNTTRIIAPVETVQLVCKIARVQPPAKPARIAFVAPKTRPE